MSPTDGVCSRCHGWHGPEDCEERNLEGDIGVKIDLPPSLVVDLLVQLGEANDYGRRQQPAIQALREKLKETLLKSVVDETIEVSVDEAPVAEVRVE